MEQQADASQLIDTALRLLLVAALVVACLWIAAPFLTIMMWSGLLAVMLWPLHVWLRAKPLFTNARSATLIGIVTVALLAVPLELAVSAIANSLFDLAASWRAGTLTLPALPDWLARVPVIGQKLALVWQGASGDIGQLLVTHGDTVRMGATRLARIAAGTFLSLLGGIVAFAVAAIFLAWGEESSTLMRKIFVRVTNSADRGERLLVLSAATIRGVLQGVVGVALVQAILLGIGFVVAGVPYAVSLALVALLLGIIQVPAAIVALPVIAWVWNHLDASTAGIFTVWTLIAGLSDNVLKPLMLGRGMEVPMPIILIGVIGGMVADGLLGLFMGPVILAVGYVLFVDWLKAQPGESVPE